MKKSQINSIFINIFSVLAIFFATTCNVIAQKNSDSVKIVVIDAGHGGKDPGALGKTTKEKNLTLAIALKVGNYIKKNVKGVEVIYTRETDEFVALDKRADIANKANADLFISIHINSVANKNVRGASTYVTGLARSKENIELALQENSAAQNEENYQEKYGDLNNINSEDYIVSTLFQNTHSKQSVLFAGKIQNQFEKRAGRKNLGVKQANFAVLWRTTMPCVLIECGFISNASEEQYMSTDDGQSYLASAIYRAFKEYKTAVESGKIDEQLLEIYEKYGSLSEIADGKNPNQDTKTESTTKTSTKTTDTKTTTKPTETKTQAPTKTQKSTSNYCFRVQLKSSTEKIPLNSKVFKGIENVEEIKIDGVYKYTVGCETDIKKITNLQTEVRKKIPDAFVIAVKDGKRVDFNTAKKELGK